MGGVGLDEGAGELGNLVVDEAGLLAFVEEIVDHHHGPALRVGLEKGILRHVLALFYFLQVRC